MSPALAGGFLSTEHQGSLMCKCFIKIDSILYLFTLEEIRGFFQAKQDLRAKTTLSLTHPNQNVRLPWWLRW